jgi:hypothetical protein
MINFVFNNKNVYELSKNTLQSEIPVIIVGNFFFSIDWNLVI